MASRVPKTAHGKPSFASIAAMAPPSLASPAAADRENEAPGKPASQSAPNPKRSMALNESLPNRELQDSMSRLDVNGPPASKTLNEQAKSNIKRAGLRLDDDQTHVSSSSNKAPSLDGKSTASGTTFALDEKESLRPDDSASAKAVEDEDSMSGPASGAPNSRVGSEAGGRAFRDQFYEVTESIGSAGHRPHPLSRKIIEGIEEEGPQISQPPLLNSIQAPATLHRSDVAPPMQSAVESFYREPDEKLFEALESPKDRIFLLRLEEDIINFIKDSSELKIDLPPCNSFCRLLAHKLADYYALTHFVDNAVSSVTLYRTPYCRIPTPLSELAKVRAVTTTVVAPSIPPAMKIMRRPGNLKDSSNVDSGAATTESSAIPSKATSETGEDSQQGTGVVSPTESTAARDKGAMTREEREARYKEKREELFGPQTEDADSAESAKEISRTSSRNEKKRRKPKKEDDGFEARSQFNAYYPTMQFPINPFDQTNNPQAFFTQYAMQSANLPHQPNMMGVAMTQPNYAPGFPSIPGGQPFPAVMGQTSIMNGYNNQAQMYASPSTQNFNQQTPTQYYAQIHPSGGMGQQSSAMSSPGMGANAQLSRPQSQMSDQQWTQNAYGNPYQHAQQQQQPQQMYPATAPSIPYPYGQLPYQAGMQNGKPAHPLPGSYNRQTFNPQTRAFVPGGNSVPSPANHFVGNKNLYPVPAGTPTHNVPVQFPNGGTYANYPQPSPYAPIHYNQPPQEVPTKNFNGNRKSAAQPQSNTQITEPASQQSSLSKWGTPANLPPKPPPPEAPSMSEGQHTLPMNNQFGVNVQAMNGGQPMPSFQNGVYTMPGVGGP